MTWPEVSEEVETIHLPSSPSLWRKSVVHLGREALVDRTWMSLEVEDLQVFAAGEV